MKLRACPMAASIMGTRVHFDTGKASGQPGIVSNPPMCAVSSRVSSHRGTTWPCCGGTRLRTHETGERIDLPAAGIYRFVDGFVIDSRMFHFDIAALLKFLNGNTPGWVTAPECSR